MPGDRVGEADLAEDLIGPTGRYTDQQRYRATGGDPNGLAFRPVAWG
jgi:hypothetical protein